MTSESNSPLAVTQPQTLDQLFELDPAEMTDDQYAQVVAEFRANRLRWAEEDRSAKNAGRRARTSKGAKIEEELGITLDLDIESLGKKK